MSNLNVNPAMTQGQGRSPSPARRVRRQNDASDSTSPLIEDIPPQNPPLAGPEIDDLDENRPPVNSPYPGMDDSFYNNGSQQPNGGDGVTKVHVEGVDTRDNHPMQPIPNGGNINPNFPEQHFPYAPGYGPYHTGPAGPRTEYDFGTSAIPGDLESIPDVNVYQHKKTLAQGMMDLALFSANANQLRYVLESFERHPYYYPSVILISISLFIQVAIGVGLISNSRYNVKDNKEICIANKINNYTIIGIFLVTTINVFISAFGVASAPVTIVAAVAPP